MTANGSMPVQEPGQERDVCMEIAGTLGALRDSKNPAGPVLHADLTALLTEIKSGRFRD